MNLFETVGAEPTKAALNYSRTALAESDIGKPSTTESPNLSLAFSSLLGNKTPPSESTDAQRKEPNYGDSMSQDKSLSVDLSVAGEGYLVVGNQAGDNYLTRTDSFALNADGHLVDIQNRTLLGYPYDSGIQDPVETSPSDLVPITLPPHFPGDRSSYSIISGNLDSSAEIIDSANLPGATSDSTTKFTRFTNLKAYDSSGNPVTYDVYFSKIGNNSWQVAIFDSSGRDPVTGAFPYGPSSLVIPPFDLVFDDAGWLQSRSSMELPSRQIDGDLTVLSKIDLHLNQLTQRIGDFSLETFTNGNPPCDLQQLQVSENGTVFARYTGGGLLPRYHLAVAAVEDPSQLTAISTDVFSQSEGSGQMVLLSPKSSGMGYLLSSRPETSASLGVPFTNSNLVAKLATLELASPALS